MMYVYIYNIYIYIYDNPVQIKNNIFFLLVILKICYRNIHRVNITFHETLN